MHFVQEERVSDLVLLGLLAGSNEVAARNFVNILAIYMEFYLGNFGRKSAKQRSSKTA